MAQHKWIKSTLGHGEAMCEHCSITNREAAVLGKLNDCEKAPEVPLNMDNLSDEEKEYRQRYHVALHAMQSGVAAKMGIDASDTSSKHLRVGINSAFSDSGALAWLLIQKGVITRTEYLNAQAEGMERERAGYERYLTEFYRTPTSLA